MPTIDIILRSKFLAHGTEGAIEQLRAIQRAGEKLSIERGIPGAAEKLKELGFGEQAAAVSNATDQLAKYYSTLDRGNVSIDKAVERMKSQRDLFLSAARGAFQQGDPELVGQFSAAANELQTHIQRLERVKASTDDYDKAIKGLASSGEKSLKMIDGAWRDVTQQEIRAAKEVLSTSDAYKKLGVISEEAIREGFDPTQGPEEKITTLRKLAEDYRNAAQAAEELGLSERATRLDKQAQVYENVARGVERISLHGKQGAVVFSQLQTILQGTGGSATELSETTQRLSTSLKSAVLQNLEFEGGLQGAAARLRQMADAADETAEAVAREGRAEEAVARKALAARLRAIAGELHRAEDAAKDMGKSVGLLPPALQGALDGLNRFGFGLFLVTQNARTMQMIVGGAFNTLLEGARRLDRDKAFTSASQRINTDVGKMRDNLRGATKGLIDFSEAQLKYNEAVRAGLPDLAKQAPTIANMAIGLAQASGDIEKSQEVYNDLMTAIIKGQPEMIENAGLLTSMGEAADKYRARLGGLNEEELTSEERSAALLNIVLDLGREFVSAGKNADGLATNMLQVRGALSETSGVIKEIAAADFAATLEEIGLALDPESIDRYNEKLRELGVNLFFATEVIERLWDFSPASSPLERLAIGEQAAREFVFTLFEGEGAVKAFGNAWESLKSSFDPGKIFKEAQGETFEFAKRLYNIEPAASNATRALSGLAELADDIASLPINARIDAWLERLQSIQDGELSLQADLFDNWRDFNDRLEDLQEDRNERLEEIWEDRNDKIADAWDKYQDRVTDIDEDLNDDLNDIEEDATEDRVDAAEDRNEKLEKVERDHQRRLRDIQRKFEQSRLKALIERDAEALFEAEQNKKQDLEKEQERYQDKRQEALEAYQEELEDIQEQEEKKRKELQEAADKRREDALEAYEEQREDILEQYEEEREDILEQYDERREDAVAALHEQNQDMIDSYNERKMITAIKEAAINLEQARKLGVRGRDLETFISGAKTAWTNYYQYLTDQEANFEFNPPLPPSGGNTSPGSGGDSSGQWIAPQNCDSSKQYAGTCNPNVSPTSASCGGAIWSCDPYTNRWTNLDYQPGDNRGATGGTSGTVGTGSASSGGIRGIAGGGTGGGRVPVVITVQGDNTLEQIFREISYDAFMDIVE